MPDLSTPTPMARVKALNAQLQVQRYAYYIKADPLVTDEVYDATERELRQLVKDNPQLEVLATTLKEVGSDLVAAAIGTPIKHSRPVLSLDNAYDIETATAWTAKHPAGTSYVMEPKVDGLSLSVRYVDWTLWLCCTRGDGVSGEDVTAAAMTIADVPHTLDRVMFPPNMEVRGEVFLTRQRFAEINAEMLAQGKEPYKTSRNLASGTLKSHDLAEVARRGLRFQPWQVIGLGPDEWLQPVRMEDGKWVQTADGRQRYAPKPGEGLEDVATVSYPQGLEPAEALHWYAQWTRTRQFQGQLVFNKEDLPDAIEQGRKLRDGLWADVIGDTDGLVIKVASEALRKQLGDDGHLPRWAIAYKFPAMRATTKLNEITWQVGRTGKLTPVAELEPVVCGGTLNSRANLNNWTYLSNLGVQLNDLITIFRGGEVIPQVEGVAEPGAERLTPVKPTVCPWCHEPLTEEITKDSGILHLSCGNPFCQGRMISHLTYLASRACLDIEGLGDVLAEQLVLQGVVSNLGDLWGWADESQAYIDQAGEDAFRAACTEAGFPAAQCVTLVAGCRKAKTAGWDLWLMALGIPSIAKELGKALAAFLNLGADDLPNLPNRLLDLAPKQVDGLGGERIKEIAAWARDPRAIACLNQLYAAGVRPTGTVVIKEGPQPLAGEVILVTGEFGPEREHLKKQLEGLGAVTKSGVSSKLTLVLAGDGAGQAKLSKIAELNASPKQLIKIRTEGREWLIKVFEAAGLTLDSRGMDDIPDAFDGL